MKYGALKQMTVRKKLTSSSFEKFDICGRTLRISYVMKMHDYSFVPNLRRKRVK